MEKATGFIKQFFSLLVVLLAIYFYYIGKAGLHQSFQCAILGRCPQIVIEGTVAPGFERVKEIFTKNYEAGDEVSSCVVAYHKNEKVVDLCGGFTDSGLPYRRALNNVFSSTKVVCAVAIGMLVDRGLLSYEEKVTTYWPEFAQGGKENVTVSDLLTHSGGIAWLDDPVDLEQLADFDLVAKRIAEQKHNFNSTKRQAYHGMTYAFTLSELVRRTDPKKRSIGQFIRDEVNAVLGTEIYIGLKKEEVNDPEFMKRYTSMHDTGLLRYFFQQLLRLKFDMFKSPMDFDLFMKTLNSVKIADESVRNTIDYFMVEIGAANGLSNAESLARLAAAMALKGTFGGKQIISPETFERSMVALPSEQDYIFKMNFTRTVGGFAEFNWHDRYPAYGWAGYGGSICNWDPSGEIGFSDVMNGAIPELIGGRGAILMAAVQEIVHSKRLL